MDFLHKILYSVLVFFISIFINFISGKIYKIFLKNKLSARNNTICLLILNTIRYSILLISILIIVTIFEVDMTTLVAGAGFLGLLLGVGMQKLFQDMISGFFIIFENQYIVGEYVTINNITGLVEEIGLKTTKLKTYEGELFIFSNGYINEILNYLRYPSLSLVDIHIPYIYSMYDTMNIIKDITKNYKNKNIITNIDVLGIQKVEPTYYDIRITCYTKPYEHFSINRDIRSYIIEKLKKHNINVNVDMQINVKNN